MYNTYNGEMPSWSLTHPLQVSVVTFEIGLELSMHYFIDDAMIKEKTTLLLFLLHCVANIIITLLLCSSSTIHHYPLYTKLNWDLGRLSFEQQGAQGCCHRRRDCAHDLVNAC